MSEIAIRHAGHALEVEETRPDGWSLRYRNDDAKAFRAAAAYFADLWEGGVPLTLEHPQEGEVRVRVTGRLVDPGAGVLRLRVQRAAERDS